MGGKSKADNSQVVNEQRAEAAQATQKEADRQARLQQGLASIKTAFEGSPVTAPKAYDWSNFKAPEAMPAVMSQWLAQNPGTAAPDFSKTGSAPAGYKATQGGVTDASGKFFKQGTPLTVQSPTGETTGGFDDAFYNKYKQAVLDYYMPQVSKQYKDAGDELTYRLARSGNITSSAGNTATSDLAEQNTLNQANVRNQADTAAGDLRTQVASEEAKATSQLYATEDPEVAANTALSSVRDISLKQPDLSPLSAIFNVANVGGANILKGYQSQQLADAYKTALASGGAARNQRTV